MSIGVRLVCVLTYPPMKLNVDTTVCSHIRPKYRVMIADNVDNFLVILVFGHDVEHHITTKSYPGTCQSYTSFECINQFDHLTIYEFCRSDEVLS